MRCLYETLGVSRDASEDEIRKSYRKQALKWHPDKNQDNLEHAEEQFKAVQNAYEVLNDPQERSWYDRHRDQILRSGERHQVGGGTGWEPGQKPDDEIDLFQFFTSSCYQGFGDWPKGFYAVYGNLFAELAKQEMAAWEAQLEHEDEPEPGPFPHFGDSQLGTADLQAFYTFWLNFITVKDFSWADMYNPASAPDRRVRRKMQEENKKARRVVRQEFVDTVRQLTAFVRKRDKRYQALQQQEKLRRETSQKAEQERRKAERRERVAAAAAKADADWVTASEAQAWEEAGLEAAAGSGEEEHLQCFLCAVCDKVFKSEKQLANHEKSKKHKEQLSTLRKLLEEEEEAAEALQQGACGAGEGAGRNSGAEEAEERQRGARGQGGSAGGDEGGDADWQGGSEARSRKKKKKKKKLPRGFRDAEGAWQPGDGSEEGSGGGDCDDAAGTDSERELIERMASMGATGAQGDDADGSGGESGGDAGEEHAPTLPETAVEPAEAGPMDEPQPEAAGCGRQGLSHQALKRQKRREKQARQAAVSSGGRSVESAGLRCTVCRVLFPSRNKLFQHIKDTGHAALKRN